MELEIKNVKIEILKLKLQTTELQVEKIHSINRQEYDKIERIKEQQFLIFSRLGQAKVFLEAQLNSLERTPLNYPLLQEINNILLEFNEEDLGFRYEFFDEMNQQYDDLGIKWKELQQSGEFTNAKEVNDQRVDIGKFIGKIPN